MEHPATTKADAKLIEDLFKLAAKNKRLVRSTLHDTPTEPFTRVRSWKMDEYKYYQVPSPFPTLARGLFTVKTKGTSDDEKSEHRIVVRGYDKFFNIGEVPWTTWEALEKNTVPPYVLSLKSNGCIIFIGALTPEKLLITSKHSLGTRGGTQRSHAEAGEEWLRKYLAQKGRTEQQLAAVLWEKNWTAVAELCDDSFEEHVLPYPPELTGLHLHGINENIKAFKTVPTEVVDAFAEEWGFIKTKTHTVQSIAEVRAFTNEVAQTGQWAGEAVEGFVVRTHVGQTQSTGNTRKETPPYPEGSTFFFKVKFDEPYMMYRDWREVTRMLLSGKGGLSPSSLPKSKMARAETRAYVKWVIEEIKRDRKQFDGFTSGHGIIATRERFLKWLASKEGKDDMDLANAKKDLATSPAQQAGIEYGKTIIVPVAIPGCGKTAVAIALAKIYGFGHTQSDDVKAKKAAPAFIKNVSSLLDKHDVVIADKNNHLKQHRTALRDLGRSRHPAARLLALQWPIHSLPQATVHRICADRVLARGENHQTLISTPESKQHEDVIWQFIGTTEELTEDEVDDIIEMEIQPKGGLEGAIRYAVNAVADYLGLEKPNEEQIVEGIAASRSYAATKNERTFKKEKEKPPRYFGLLAEVDFKETLDEQLGEGNEFWDELKKRGRVAARPHVTLAHSKEVEQSEELADVWKACMKVHELPVGPLLEFKLGHAVWDGRVMALTIDDLKFADEGGADGLVKSLEGLSLNDQESAKKSGQSLLKKLEPFMERLHITVGTRNGSILPVEAKELVQTWRKGKADSNVQSVALKDAHGKGRVKGLMS